ITDTEHKMVFTRLGNRLRVAGTAEFNGYNNEIEDSRSAMTMDLATNLFPNACDETRSEFWTGLRPSTPDGVPVIGRGRQENLLLNTGHGTLGWTMAAGSGRIIASLARGVHPEVDISGIGWERFS
ncbi:MAG: FAD-dependent oxidoreductase, partial [Rhodospirillaceae bacterium]|nr:FAD-dependent oxidoreductase [Rhodospirillaceae bacterium]